MQRLSEFDAEMDIKLGEAEASGEYRVRSNRAGKYQNNNDRAPQSHVSENSVISDNRTKGG
eukprot:gene7185-292_t